MCLCAKIMAGFGWLGIDELKIIKIRSRKVKGLIDQFHLKAMILHLRYMLLVKWHDRIVYLKQSWK